MLVPPVSSLYAELIDCWLLPYIQQTDIRVVSSNLNLCKKVNKRIPQNVEHTYIHQIDNARSEYV